MHVVVFSSASSPSASLQPSLEWEEKNFHCIEVENGWKHITFKQKFPLCFIVHNFISVGKTNFRSEYKSCVPLQ